MRITLPSGTEAELAQPATGVASAGLVIAPDIFGLRLLYDQMVQRLADEWDMTVVAVEPFPGRDLGPDIEPRAAAVPTLDDATHLRDLLEGAEVTAHDTVGLLGYCMGGMYCHKAAISDRFHRIVSFYGMIRVPEAWRSGTHGEPLDYLARGHADRVLAIIGDRDHYTPADDVAALAAMGVTVVSYPDAEHGFAHDPNRPAHRPADAADAFERARVWLQG
jgi:carboxymethylenebutenolidase